MTGPTVGVVWHDAKTAALLFDQILPVGDYDLVPRELRFDVAALESAYLFLPTEYYAEGKTAWDDFLETVHAPPYHPEPGEIPYTNDLVLSACVGLRRLGVRAVPILAGPDWRLELLEPRYYGTSAVVDMMDYREGPGWPTSRECLAAVSQVLDGPDESEYLEVAFNGMPRVETRELPWTRIADFRASSETSELFRRFHLTLERDAAGKDPDYVRRLIDDRVSLLRRAARTHRVELVQETTRTLLNAKTIAAGAVTAATGYLQNPLVAAGLGAAVAAEVSMTVLKQRRSRAAWLHGAELGYLTHIEDSLGR